MSQYTNDLAKINSNTAAVQEQSRGHWAHFPNGTSVMVMNGALPLYEGVVVGSHKCEGICRVIHVQNAAGLHKVDAARVKVKKGRPSP